MNYRRVDIRAEAEDALRLVEGRAEECGIKTNIIQEGELPPVMADRESLRSVFTNLVINAVEAINGAGGSVSIKLSNPEANSVKVEITDSGCGIAADDISKVFEPYFSTKETGTGSRFGDCEEGRRRSRRHDQRRVQRRQRYNVHDNSTG